MSDCDKNEVYPSKLAKMSEFRHIFNRATLWVDIALEKTECDEPQKRKADLDAYYQYIIKAFQDYLDGGTPHCFSPHIDIMSFESWRETLPELERYKLAEAEATKKCAKVLDDIKGISNMGGGASCAAS